MSVQGWLRKSSSGMLLRIVARQVSDETLSLRLAVTGPALFPARLEDSWNVLDWESVPRWQFWIFALRVWWSDSLDCWPDPWGTWALSKSHPAWLQISVGKTDMMTKLNLSETYRMKCRKTDTFILPPFNIVILKTGDICMIQFYFFLTPLKRTTTASSDEENTHNRWSWSGHFDAWTRVLGILGHLGVQNILFHHF